MKHLHFISGLPRAGTTLLASLLRQNPAVHASIMSPIGQVVTDAVTAMGERNEARSFITDVDRGAIVKAVFNAYYAGSRPHVFDNNRRWLGNMDLVARLWPDALVIAMVRPVAEIVDSFECVFRAGIIKPSVIYGGLSNTTVYDRFDVMMQKGGVIGYAHDALKDAWYGSHKDRCLFIEYGMLASKPQETMDVITAACRLPPWKYDFDKIQQVPGAVEFDQQLSTPGLHALMPTVKMDNRAFILPPDIVGKCPAPFWRVKKPATS